MVEEIVSDKYLNFPEFLFPDKQCSGFDFH